MSEGSSARAVVGWSVGRQHGKEIMGDVRNYTDIQPQIQISEIVG